MRGRPWTDEEMAELEIQYNVRCLKDIRIPGRSLKAIQNKAQYQMFRRKPTIDDYRAMMMKYPNRGVSWIARKMGVAKNTVSKYFKLIKGSHEEKRVR